MVLEVHIVCAPCDEIKNKTICFVLISKYSYLLRAYQVPSTALRGFEFLGGKQRTTVKKSMTWMFLEYYGG